jgi:hypothetical protein
MSLPLSSAMRVSLQWMEQAALAGREPHGVVANTMDGPHLSSGQVWMAIATGRALERRGLIRIGEEGDAYLVTSVVTSSGGAET